MSTGEIKLNEGERQWEEDRGRWRECVCGEGGGVVRRLGTEEGAVTQEFSQWAGGRTPVTK